MRILGSCNRFARTSTCRHQQPQQDIKQPSPLLMFTASTDYGRCMAWASTLLLRADAEWGWSTKAELLLKKRLSFVVPFLASQVVGWGTHKPASHKTAMVNSSRSPPSFFFSLPPLPVVSGGSKIIRNLCVWWIHESFIAESMLCTLETRYYKWLMFI